MEVLKEPDWRDQRRENRLVIVFPGGEKADWERFQKDWGRPESLRGTAERRLKILVPDSGVESTTRRRAGVRGDGFALVLVGLDGGVKFRSDKPVTPEDIFRIIDRMPMRRVELERER